MKAQVKSSWETMTDKLSSWIDAAIFNLPNIIIALVIFLLAYWLSRNIHRWINKLLKNQISQPSVRNLISSIASIVCISLGLLLALEILNLDQVLTSLLAGAGVAGLAVGLALQGTLSNTFSGIFLAVRDVINVGDWVETNGFEGRVVEIDLRNTKVKEPDNNIVVLPNKLVLENPFKNYGLTKRIRATIKCGIAYNSDLRAVRELAISTIKKLFPPKSQEQIEFHYLEFGDSAILFQLRFWVSATANLTALEVKSEAIIALKEAFDANQIEIPFPIRTLYMNSE